MRSVEPPGDIAIGWCLDGAKAPGVATFFVDHAGTAYISHSELQTGRASAVGRWSPGLAARIEAEARDAIETAAKDGPGARCAEILAGERLVGIAFVRFETGADRPFGVLEDLLIEPAWRNLGIGRQVMDWVAAECRARGCGRLFLESGAGNHQAHRLFERHGFHQTSIVMMRDVSTS